MLEAILDFFKAKPRRCEVCTTLTRVMEQTHTAWTDHIASLEKTIEDLRSERDILQHNLMKAVRLERETTSNAPQQATPGALGQQFRGSARNWGNVRDQLERKHKVRPMLPEDAAKLKAWEDANAKAEQEIPALREALSQHQVDVDELAK